MKFADHLSKEDIRNFNQLRKAERNKKEHKTVSKPKKKEHFSRRQLEDLMDVNKDVYKRVNGAWRRR